MVKLAFKVGLLYLIVVSAFSIAVAQQMSAPPASVNSPPIPVNSTPASVTPSQMPMGAPPESVGSSQIVNPTSTNSPLPSVESPQQVPVNTSPPSVYAPQTPVSIPPASENLSSSSKKMTLREFHEWVEKNGYAQNKPDLATNVNALSQQAKNKSLALLPSLPDDPPPRIVRLRQRGHRGTKPISFEESQEVMLHSVPSTSTPPSDDSQAAFSALLQQNMPLVPTQVVRLRQQIDVAQRAAAIPANIPPKPVSTTLMVNLAPGATPPAIRLAQGYVSSLVFVDSTGAPWPIAAFDIGNPRAVNIQWDGKSNIILIQGVSPYANGNMVIRLVGLPTPITLEIVAGQRVVDYRVDIHVSGIGPNAKEVPIGSVLPSSANELLLGVLDGVGPDGSRQLTVAGADAQAWLLNDKIYLRTRLTVLSPGWIGKMVSPDGMQAYEIPKTSSVLISRYGEPAELRIEGF